MASRSALERLGLGAVGSGIELEIGETTLDDGDPASKVDGLGIGDDVDSSCLAVEKEAAAWEIEIGVSRRA